jgi:cyanophycinase
MRRLIVRVLVAMAAVTSFAGGGGCAVAGNADVPSPVMRAEPSSAIAPHLGAGQLVVYPRVGGAIDDGILPLGPALVLMGGGADVDDAFTWSHAVIAGGRRVAGDVVVLTVNGDDHYGAYLASTADFNSVQTVRIPPSATDEDMLIAARIVSRAEMVFLTAEDPSSYLRWRRTPIIAAIQAVFDRGGVIGGTGGGAAALGEGALDGVESVESSDAVQNPFEKSITFTRRVFRFGQLEGAIVDPHFRSSDRFGRLAAFMARQIADGALTTHPPIALGIGIDEGSALLIDAFGRVSLAQAPDAKGGGYIVTGGAAQQIAEGTPLVYEGLLVARLDQKGEAFDTSRGCGTAFLYRVSIDGAASETYSPRDPYVAPGAQSPCVY